MKKLTCVIYTNTPSLEANLIELIGLFTSVEILDVFRNKITVIEKLNELTPDLLYIDIADDSASNIELLGLINKPPFIIGITDTHDDIPFMLDNGFYDFLFSKELTKDYFCRKMSKVIKLLCALNSKETPQILQEAPSNYDIQKNADTYKEYIFVKYQKMSTKVKFDDILYVKNVGNALKIAISNGKYVYHNCTLKKFLAVLPENLVRVNNSTIINVNKIEKYHKNNLSIKEEYFPISRIYAEEVKKQLNLP